MHYNYVVFFALSSYCLAAERRIKLITLLPYNMGVGFDIVRIGAAFDLSAERLNDQYAGQLRVTATHLYNTSHYTCNDITADSARMVMEYYYAHEALDTCHAIVTTGCSDWTGVTSIAQGLDWPVFINGFAKDEIFSEEAHSTMALIGMAGTYAGHAEAVLNLLSTYKWYHIAIVLEKTTSTAFYGILATALEERVKDTSFVLDRYTIDRTDNRSCRRELKAVKRKTRVLLFLTLGKTALYLLRIADEMDMANGEYVFINVQPLQGSDYGTVSQFAYRHNTSSPRALRSLMFVAGDFHPIPSDNGSDQTQTQLMQYVAHRAKQAFNFTLDLPTLIPVQMQISFNIMELFAAAVAELGDMRQACGGRNLAKQIANKTFRTSLGPVFVDSSRIRNVDLDVFGFNNLSQENKPIGKYRWFPFGHFTWDQEMNWPTADGRPPKDTPLCGFQGTDGPCAEKVFSVTAAAVSVSVCLMVIAGFACFGRWFRVSNLTSGLWLQADGLGEIPNHGRSSRYAYDQVGST